MKKRIVVWLVIMLICLVLCANAEKSGIDVLVRGQTAIMRIDKEWLQTYANQDVGYSPDSYISHSEETISESEMQYYLEGAEYYYNQDGIYEAFMADYAEDNYASFATIYDVCIKVDQSTMLMYISSTKNDSWYLIFRQLQQPDSAASVHYGIDFRNVCNYSADRIIARDGVIVRYADVRYIPDSLMSIHAYDGGAGKRIQRGNICFEIFRGLDINIVVITKPATEEDFMKYADLMIGDNRYVCGTGYMDGDSAVYCIIMDDSGLQSLLDHTEVNLIMAETASLMEY